MAKIKLDSKQVQQIKWLCQNTCLIDREIAEVFGVSRKHINAIRNKKRWNYDYGQNTNRNLEEQINTSTSVYG